MKDSISRQMALDALKNSRFPGAPYVDSGISIAIGVICDLPPAQPECQWIPCSERMPEEGERVLATHLGGVNPNNQVIEHIYQHGEFTCGWDMDMNVDSPTFGQRYMGEVIAWMPSPKPYRKDNHETD